MDLGALVGSGIVVPTMTDEEWAWRDAQVAAVHKQDEQRERRERRTRLLDAGWPQRALSVVSTADIGKPGMAAIDAWDSTTQSVLLLSGAAGCGKTCAAAYWALNRAHVTAFVRASTFAATSRYDTESRSKWLHARSLVLDDLGAEYVDAKGNFLTDLDELVDHFYADGRPLIITTNITPTEFPTRYGTRITDRLREAGRWQNIGGGSLRKRVGS